MNETARQLKIVLCILNIMLWVFGILYITVGWVMSSGIKSREFLDDAWSIPITIVLFGAIMVVLSVHSLHGLITQKAGHLTANSVLNLILMLLQIYFSCYLWWGLPHKIQHTVPYLWHLGGKIIKWSIFIPITLELFSFSISCYIADVILYSELHTGGYVYAV